MRAEAIRWGECFSWDVTADVLLDLLRERVAGSWEPIPTETTSRRHDAAIALAAGA
jgi:hypothetical protein